MKINPKLYNSITTEPFDVQELPSGVVIELHSLNQNEALFNEYAPKAKFAIWSSIDGNRYRLILEDSYYPRMREFYGKRVNQCMIDFWDAVEKERGKIMKFLFIPVSILVFVVFIVLMIFAEALGETGQTVAMAVTLVSFIVVNVFVNKKIDSIVNKNNSEAIEKIKNIIGHKRFDELLNEQQAHYDDFFGINNEEENETVVEEAVEETSSEE